MGKLAPIGICTYSRIKHLKQTISALKKNTLASDSEVFIFSDAPSSRKDEKSVTAIREYINTIDGFKTVHSIQRRRNCHIDNCERGLKQLLDGYGRAIFMEDDIIAAPGFLQFMNDGLNFYKNNKQIFSMTGYSPPIGAHSYVYNDVFTLPRFNFWGVGIWEDRFKQITKVSKNEFKKLLKDKNETNSFINGGGEDMLPMLRLEVEGKINALDVRAMFCQFKSKQLTIYPKKSLTQNIGHDGSGIHCGLTNKFNVMLWGRKEFQFTKNIRNNEKIIRANREFRKLRVRTKILETIKNYRLLLN